MSDDDATPRARLGRIIETALAGGLGGAISGIPAGPIGVAAGVSGGVLLGATTAVRRELVSTPNERLEREELEATHDAARQVPGLTQRVSGLEAVALQLVDELDHQRKARSRARISEVARTLLQLVADGHAKADDFDGQQHEAITEVLRFSLDALRPEAVPMIARLSPRPVDHFFRGVCRVLVDLDARELAQLVELIATAARAWPDLARSWPLEHEPREGLPRARNEIDLEKFDQDDGKDHRAVYLRWRPLPNESGLHVPSDSPIVPLLVAHRLAVGPNTFVARRGAGLLGGDALATRAFTMTSSNLLNLHFVLTGERIADPGP